MIEVENGRMIDLTLYNTLHTPGLHFNLISIPKIYNLELEVYFRTDDVIIKFNNSRVVIWGIQQGSFYYVKVMREPLTLAAKSVGKTVTLDD